MTDSEKDRALAHYTALAQEAGQNPGAIGAMVAHATATANQMVGAAFPVRFSHPRLGIYETESSYRARFAKWWMTGVPDRIGVRRDARPRVVRCFYAVRLAAEPRRYDAAPRFDARAKKGL